jgi:ketosteroid isomerase-like protein
MIEICLPAHPCPGLASGSVPLWTSIGAQTATLAHPRASVAGQTDAPQSCDAQAVHGPLIDAYFDALNQERWEPLSTLFASDATLHAPGSPPRGGRDAIGMYFVALLAPYVAHRHEVVRTHVAGGVVTVEVHVRAALANGESVEFDAVELFDVAGGVISRLRRLHDSQRVRSDLAQALAASSPAGEVKNGSLSHLTPARLRAALLLVRRGESFRLDGGGAAPLGYWRLPPNASPRVRGRLEAGLQARAVVLDVGADLDDPQGGDVVLGAADLVAAADDRSIEIRPGDVVLIRTGSAGVASGALLADREMIDWVGAVAPSAICIDRPALFRGVDGADGDADRAARDELGLVAGLEWSLDALCADCGQDDLWEALVVSLPAAGADADSYAANASAIK